MDVTLQAGALRRELQAARVAEASGAIPQAWRCLELAHVIGQHRIPLHWRAHWAMLGLAYRTGNGRETAAQVLRLTLTPLGHLTRRLPRFNPGSSRVGPFEQADWPAELDPTSLERRSRVATPHR